MKNLEGHAIPAVCVIKAIGWLHIALVTKLLHLPAVQSSLAFDKFTTKVLEALLKWVTMPRSRAELDAYVALQCQCSTSQQGEATHRMGQQEHGRSEFQHDHPRWYFLALCLRAPVMYGTKGDPCAALTRMDKLRRRKAWPYSIRGLLPHGPQKTFEGVLQWLQLDLHSRDRVRFIAMLNVLLVFCEPVIVPYLVTSPVFVRSCLLEPIQRDELSIRTVTSTADIDNCVDIINCVEVLVGRLMRALVTEKASDTELLIFHRAEPVLLLEAYAGLLRICRKIAALSTVTRQDDMMNWNSPQRIERIERAIKALSVKLIVDCGELAHLDSTASLRTLFSQEFQKLHDPQLAQLHYWDRAVSVVHSLETAQRCVAPVCLTLISDCALKLCTGCGLTRYCSRRCQKVAWRHAEVPHRDIYSVLARLCVKWNIPQVNIQVSMLNQRPRIPAREHLAPEADLLFPHFWALSILKLDALGL
jgi:hypothetical protein